MLESILWGPLFYTIALILALKIYANYSPLYQRIVRIILLSWLGHFVGGYLYTLEPSDSLINFFANATPVFSGLNTPFVWNMTWYVREYMTGDSFLATVYFFSAFAFLGSVLWYVLYLQLAQALKISNQKYIFPALVIMCWPSFLLFTAGIGKDSLSYFLIPLIFLSWNEFIYLKKNKILMLIILSLSLLLLTMIRPYLLMIFVVSYGFSTIRGATQITLTRVLLILAIIPIMLYVTSWVLEIQGHITSVDMSEIEGRSVRQQELQNHGTSYPILSQDPNMQPILLPYNFTMNLIMPLFVLSNNMVGILASFENLFLICLIYQFLRKRKLFQQLKSQSDLIKECFYFFLVGMSFMSIMNTNLGLAMRQKSMYLPAFLIVAMLVWLYNKQTKHKESFY